MFIQDSRRSYRTYAYATEFKIIRRYPYVPQRLRNVYRYCGTYSYTEVLVSTTELILILRSIYWSYRTWTCISDLIHVLQSVYLSYGSYTGLTELILVLRILYCNSDTEVPVGTTEYFNGTRVPVATTEQIPYTKVLVGTTGLILILLIHEYP